LELGRARRTLDQASFDAALAEIRRAPGIIEATIEANGAVVREYARSVADASAYYILGGGPSLATTLFMCAKLFEMPQRNGVAVELEEWAHEQYFLTRADTPVLVVAPPGSSLDRAREQMRGARDMGGRVVAICDHEDETTKGMAHVVFPIVGQLPEEFSPLTYCVPGELFAVELCHALGRPAFAFIEAKQYEVNMRQILRSQLR
jgi:glucosamine 6-phosphate synthetase-like amidotransferase/phosphosugar isomerase protein